MRRPALFLASFLLLDFAAADLAAAQEAARSGCDDSARTCKEGCTLDFGASAQTREKLGSCLLKCQAKHERCAEGGTPRKRRRKLRRRTLEEDFSPADRRPGQEEIRSPSRRSRARDDEVTRRDDDAVLDVAPEVAPRRDRSDEDTARRKPRADAERPEGDRDLDPEVGEDANPPPPSGETETSLERGGKRKSEKDLTPDESTYRSSGADDGH
jgi:hypothetical protein